MAAKDKETCYCKGYPFPHRKGGGKCEHNPWIMVDIEEDEPKPKPKSKRGRPPKKQSTEIEAPKPEVKTVIPMSLDAESKTLLKNMLSAMLNMQKSFSSTVDIMTKLNNKVEVIMTDVFDSTELLKSINDNMGISSELLPKKEKKDLGVSVEPSVSDANNISQEEAERKKTDEKMISLLELIAKRLEPKKEEEPEEKPKSSFMASMLKSLLGFVLKPIVGIGNLLKKIPGIGTVARVLGGASIFSNIFGGKDKMDMDNPFLKKESLLKRAIKAPIQALGNFFSSPLVGLGSAFMGGKAALEEYKKGGDFSSIMTSFVGGVTEFLTAGLVDNKDVKAAFKMASEKLSDWITALVDIGVTGIKDTMKEFENRIKGVFESPEEKEARTEKLRQQRQSISAKQTAAIPMGGYESASAGIVPEKIKLDTMVKSLEKNPEARKEYRTRVIAKGKELGIGFEEALTSNKIDRFAIAQSVSDKFEDVTKDYQKNIQKAKPEVRGELMEWKHPWGRPKSNDASKIDLITGLGVVAPTQELELLPTLNPNIIQPTTKMAAEPVARVSAMVADPNNKNISISNSFNQTTIAPSSQNNIASPLATSNPGKKLASGY